MSCRSFLRRWWQRRATHPVIPRPRPSSLSYQPPDWFQPLTTDLETSTTLTSTQETASLSPVPSVPPTSEATGSPSQPKPRPTFADATVAFLNSDTSRAAGSGASPVRDRSVTKYVKTQLMECGRCRAEAQRAVGPLGKAGDQCPSCGINPSAEHYRLMHTQEIK